MSEKQKRQEGFADKSSGAFDFLTRLICLTF